MAKRKGETMGEDSVFENVGASAAKTTCDCGQSHLLVDGDGNKDSKDYVFSDGRKLTAKASDTECKKAVATK